jgi:hypothetical protein
MALGKKTISFLSFFKSSRDGIPWKRFFFSFVRRGVDEKQINRIIKKKEIESSETMFFAAHTQVAPYKRRTDCEKEEQVAMNEHFR